MKFNLVFQEGALNDYSEGISYYEKISSDLAERFYGDFWSVIDKIKENPKHYQERYRSIRIAFTEHFPFGIHYVLDDSRITVLRVLHTSRFFK